MPFVNACHAFVYLENLGSESSSHSPGGAAQAVASSAWRGGGDGDAELRKQLEETRAKLEEARATEVALEKAQKQLLHVQSLYDSLKGGDSCLLYTSPSPRDS